MKRIEWADLLKSKTKRYGHHVIFAISILSLTLLAMWWSIFISRSIEERRALYTYNLEANLNYYSQKIQLEGTPNAPPSPGTFQPDRRFEIAPFTGAPDRLKKPLTHHWPHLCLRARETVLKKIQEDFKRKKLMVVGESSLLVLLILFSSFMLYKFIKLERRSTREVEEFWGRVTHEIKTPITGIKAFLESLKNRSVNSEQLPRYVDMALKQVETQEKLAENILAGCGLRGSGCEDRLNIKDMNLGQCLDDYFEHHALHLTDARVTIEWDPGINKGNAKTLAVQVDCNALRVIMDNLVDNALKYCSPGLQLIVSIYIRGKKAIISIQDNGPGFPPAYAKNIFSAYKHLGGELPETPHGHGSGMGLYISRQLAERMGGRLEAHSSGQGRGAEFRLYLNLAKKQQG